MPFDLHFTLTRSAVLTKADLAPLEQQMSALSDSAAATLAAVNKMNADLTDLGTRVTATQSQLADALTQIQSLQNSSTDPATQAALDSIAATVASADATIRGMDVPAPAPVPAPTPEPTPAPTPPTA